MVVKVQKQTLYAGVKRGASGESWLGKDLLCVAAKGRGVVKGQDTKVDCHCRVRKNELPKFRVHSISVVQEGLGNQ